MLSLSLGIMAYNEETNIGPLLDSVLDQEFNKAFLKEIIVVVSGSTDSTEEIVRSFMANEKRIHLFVQPKREGKASAVNIFLANATGEILILESADTIPDKNTLDKLIAPFEDKNIGMTGAHPIPINSDNTFLGYAAHFLWYKHHQVSLISPKMGELVAFRNFVKEIPNDTPVDEASIEAIIISQGYRLCYVPDAIVFNKGPEKITDFLKQRRRIAFGHKYLLQTQNHKVGTYNPVRIMINLAIKKSEWWHIKKNIWTVGVIFLEILGRLLGNYDYYIGKKKHYIWDVALTTKKLS